MAGKSRQPSHEPPRGRRKKTGTCHTDKTVERKGRDRGGETASQESPRSGEMLETLQTKTPTKRYNALWTKSTRNPGVGKTNVLLVVNSIKLHFVTA